MSTELLRLRHDRVTWREVHGEIVGLDLRASTYFSTNASGSTLWPLLAAGATRDELVAALVSTYGIPEERAGADVGEFVRALGEHGMLE